MTQAMDATGVSAAAYAITNQVYSLGVVVMLAMQARDLAATARNLPHHLRHRRGAFSAQATGATLIPSALARSAAADGDGGAGGAQKAGGPEQETGGVAAARRTADRLIVWSTMIAASLAALQFLAMPRLTPMLTVLPEVQQAVVRPAAVSALVQLTNGPLFAGEGIMMGVGAFGFLAGLTSVGVAVMVVGLVASAKLGLGVSSVWFSLLACHVVLLAGQMWHFLRLGPLARTAEEAGAAGGDVPGPDCVDVPVVGEVCVTAKTEASLGSEGA